MSNSTTNIKEIRKLVIKGFAWQYIPISISMLSESVVENVSSLKIAISIYNIFAFFSYIYGYSVLANATNKYAQYKGYKNYLYLYSILNHLGLPILFLLKSRNSNNKVAKEPLKEFNFLYIFTGWLAVSFLSTSFLALIALWIRGSEGLLEYIRSDRDFSTISSIFTTILYSWYLILEFKRSNLNYKHIFGSFKKIDFKLPLGLAITKYIFVRGINPPILYSLSFIFPQYVEYLTNKEYATTVIGWLCFAISALLLAPIIEELIFRGLILQKVAVKNSINIGLLISAIIFTLMHFRFDVVSLFVAGVLYGILYLKTKQLAAPILCHFFYNLIVVVRRIYNYFFSSVNPDAKITVIEYQQQFLEDWKWCVLFFALSAPYLCYFIYKNYPRNYSIEKLPYYANQRQSNN